MSSSLTAQNADVGYAADAAPVLQGFSAQIVPGALVGVVGPNGCGKSTLVRALSRVLHPQSGAVLLGGERDLYRQVSARDAALSVSVVPQSTIMEHEFSVREIVGMGRAPHIAPRPFASPSARDEETIDKSLAAAGIAHLSERTAGQLSGGEWQRVLLARALAQDTDVLLLDEPTAHLDLRHQSDVLTLARRLAHDGGKAVLAVLHDLNLAAAFCDRLLLLKDGRIVADGAPADVLTPALIETVYGARVTVVPHPVTGRPVVLGLPNAERSEQADARSRPKVHIVCGAGTGRDVLFALAQSGCDVTAGALHMGDADAACAAALGIRHTMETAFAPLSPAVLDETRRLMAAASVIVVTPVPLGPANVANLELVLERARMDTPVFLIAPDDFTARDFTGGRASALYAELVTARVVTVPNIAALVKTLT